MRLPRIKEFKVALLLFSLCGFFLLHGHAQQRINEHHPENPRLYQVNIDGTINPGTAKLVQHAIHTAEQKQAVALLLRINTPGGLLSSTRDIVRAIGESRIPVIGYVDPEGAVAGSAGAFILLATHIAVMHAGSNVGAATPVSGDGRDIGGTLGKKILNDSQAFMRSIAEARSRNTIMAETLVSEARSFSAVEALQHGLINHVIGDAAALRSALDGNEIVLHGQTVSLKLAAAEIYAVQPRLADRLLAQIAHPQIAHLLISLGLLAIYIEILSPGLGFPGVLGAISVILGLVSVHTLPVNMGFLMLLFLGMGLMIAEYFIAGFGALGVGGAIAFVLGSLYLFDAPLRAQHQTTLLSVSLGVSAAIVITTFLLTRSLLASPDDKRRRCQSLHGKTGEAMVSFTQRGWVLIDGQRYPAATQQALQHGDPITVTAISPEGVLTVEHTKRSP